MCNTRQNIKTLDCDKCKQLFLKKYDACSKHTFIRENGRGYKTSDKRHTFICENGCGYKTSDKRQFKQHCLKSKCNPNKPFSREFQCLLCKKQFSTEKNKQKHEKVHFDGKPHECNLCFIQFTKRHALIKHLQRKHDITLSWDTVKQEYFQVFIFF